MVTIPSLLTAGPTLSLEFFPPRTDEAQRQLEKTVAELADIDPAFVSVTCGAGGQSHDRTSEIVVAISESQPFPAVAHLTCVGHTRADIDALLDHYAASGVENILALAGDPPADGSSPTGDFTYAVELVDMIRARGGFSIGVAAHPELHPRSSDRQSDRRHLAAKLGRADYAVTQFFFDPADYFRMMDELAGLGIDKPVVPGVFPPTVPSVVRRFAEMNGTAVPAELFDRLEAADADDRFVLAVDWAAELSRVLLDGGAPGLHLYTMNRSASALAIAERLGR
jgi:methylenetetrahydrofolate reductase (NADPH)